VTMFFNNIAFKNRRDWQKITSTVFTSQYIVIHDFLVYILAAIAAWLQLYFCQNVV